MKVFIRNKKELQSNVTPGLYCYLPPSAVKSRYCINTLEPCDFTLNRVIRTINQIQRLTNFKSDFRMTLKNGFGKSVVILFISQRMKRFKHGLFVFPPEKTLICRRHCSIGQSCCSMTSKQSIDWFLESCRA